MAATAEALWWIAALDEWHLRRLGKQARLQWRALEELPAPDKIEKWDRDVMYRDRVAGRDPLDALQRAREFVTDEACRI